MGGADPRLLTQIEAILAETKKYYDQLSQMQADSLSTVPDKSPGMTLYKNLKLSSYALLDDGF